MNQNIRISVLIMCYNHEKFIADAIESVLAQTYTNYELIVADNGSTDRCGEIIASYGDKLSMITLEHNNPVRCLKMLCDAAKGDYIAFLCSDDWWYPNKLEKQVQKLQETGSEIAFTWAELVGSDLNEMLNTQQFAKNCCSRGVWIRENILNGTCLEFSSILIKNDGRFQEYAKNIHRFRQLPDVALYANILFCEEICVLEEYLVKHRMHGNNVSSQSVETLIRKCNEEDYLIHLIWEQMDNEMFVDAFGDMMQDPNLDDTIDILCQRIILYLRLAQEKSQLGSGALEYCWDHYYDEGVAELLENRYNISLAEIYEYEAKMGIGREKVLLLCEKNKEKNVGLTKEIKELLLGVIKCNKIICNISDDQIANSNIEVTVSGSLNAMMQILGKGLKMNFDLPLLVEDYLVCMGMLSQGVQKEKLDELKLLLKGINERLESLVE